MAPHLRPYRNRRRQPADTVRPQIYVLTASTEKQLQLVPHREFGIPLVAGIQKLIRPTKVYQREICPLVEVLCPNNVEVGSMVGAAN